MKYWASILFFTFLLGVSLAMQASDMVGASSLLPGQTGDHIKCPDHLRPEEIKVLAQGGIVEIGDVNVKPRKGTSHIDPQTLTVDAYNIAWNLIGSRCFYEIPETKTRFSTTVEVNHTKVKERSASSVVEHLILDLSNLPSPETLRDKRAHQVLVVAHGQQHARPRLISPEELRSLAELFKAMHSINTLSFNRLKMAIEAYPAFIEALESTKRLKALSLIRTTFVGSDKKTESTEYVANALAEGLTHNRDIKTIEMRGGKLIGDEAVSKLVDTFVNHPDIERFHIASLVTKDNTAQKVLYLLKTTRIWSLKITFENINKELTEEIKSRIKYNQNLRKKGRGLHN